MIDSESDMDEIHVPESDSEISLAAKPAISKSQISVSFVRACAQDAKHMIEMVVIVVQLVVPSMRIHAPV